MAAMELAAELSFSGELTRILGGCAAAAAAAWVVQSTA